MLQNRSFLGEIIGTQSFTVRRVEFGCIVEAGDCTQKPLKGPLFNTNQSIRKIQLDSAIVCSVRVDKNVAATATDSHWNTFADSQLLFLRFFYFSTLSRSFVVVTKTVCDFDFDLGKMDQNCMIYAEGKRLDVWRLWDQRKEKLLKAFLDHLQHMSGKIYCTPSACAFSPSEDRRCIVSVLSNSHRAALNSQAFVIA